MCAQAGLKNISVWLIGIGLEFACASMSSANCQCRKSQLNDYTMDKQVLTMQFLEGGEY